MLYMTEIIDMIYFLQYSVIKEYIYHYYTTMTLPFHSLHILNTSQANQITCNPSQFVHSHCRVSLGEFETQAAPISLAYHTSAKRKRPTTQMFDGPNRQLRQ